MIQKIFFGNTNTLTEKAIDIRLNEKFALSVIVLLIIAFGVYPQPLLNLTNGFVDTILKEVNVESLMIK